MQSKSLTLTHVGLGGLFVCFVFDDLNLVRQEQQKLQTLHRIPLLLGST